MQNKEYATLLENNKKVFIISKDNCPLCEQLKILFETLEVEFKTFIYEENRR